MDSTFSKWSGLVVGKDWDVWRKRSLGGTEGKLINSLLDFKKCQ